MNRIAQLAGSPLLTNYAITASQRAIRPVGQFIAPLCEVPDINFRYKVYSDKNRFKVPDTKRQVNGKVTRLGFSATDANGTLEPNALDFPIPNIGGLSDESLTFSIMEGQGIIADSGSLALENEIVTIAKTAALASPLTVAADFSDDGVNPITILDKMILAVKKAAKNGAAIKVLFGTTKFQQFRDNGYVQKKFIIASGASAKNGVGVVSPNIDDVSGLLIFNPEVQCSEMVIDNGADGAAENIQFLLDDVVIVFASNGTPNRMDPSFMKTFARMGGFFKPGTYTSEDERDQVLKMDWTTLPSVTNTAAVAAVR
ncbi:MAG TPA: hypothetical protein VNN22_24210 [Verrucomicrobiae bacterium]|nr:hypothetical protein [Verrucomicrobiae bacterium]